jgi:glycine dehydrogenase subunit 1
MALRVGRKRSRLLVSAGVHPEYVEVARTYLAGTGDVEIQMVPLAADGRTDLAALQAALGDDVAAVALGYPNVFGVIDDVAGAARLAEAAGAMTVSVTTEALALALLRAPGHLGADIMVAEGQSLGLPPAFGGPGVGLFAARRHHVRQMPGRLVGETVDSEGRRGYVLTLSTREQHIRREKATSNICTNQGLTALCVTVYLSLAGARGLRALAVANTRRAHAVAARLEREAGLAPAMSGPFFNEFVVRVPDLDARFEAALDAGVVAGVRLSRLFAQRADLADALLVTVTEVGEEADVDVLVQALAGRKAA